jgi:hypothetical protein
MPTDAPSTASAAVASSSASPTTEASESASCTTHASGAEDFLDTISGSQGLAGAADTVAVLRRSRGSAGAVLKITGRDVEEAELALNFDAAFGPGDYSTGRHLLPIPPVNTGNSCNTACYSAQSCNPPAAPIDLPDAHPSPSSLVGVLIETASGMAYKPRRAPPASEPAVPLGSF